MYIKNSMGPRTVPWGTPERTGWEEECVLSETTLCDLPCKQIVQVRMGMDIHQRNYPSRHKGVLGGGGGLGGQQFKSIGKLSDGHQLWFTSADSSGNGHRLNRNRPRGHFGRGVRVSHIQKSWEAVKRLDRLAPNVAHTCRST